MAVAAAGMLAGPASFAQTESTSGPDALRARYTELTPRLARNVFNRPLYIESSETSNQLSGNIYAVIDRPFQPMTAALKQPANWCEVLMLHLNTKHCAPKTNGAATTLAVSVGRKHDQQLDKAQVVEFGYTVASATDNYLDVRLGADKGPLSTRDYRIALEAVPISGSKTFLHLRYAYAYGTAARLAMQGYLATLGSDKIGFTQAGAQAGGGEPAYIGGVRGVVERNTMRYYLAIDTYLASLARPAAEQREFRTAAWFDATEQYAPQLHEVERDAYLAMKRNEFQRMRAAP